MESLKRTMLGDKIEDIYRQAAVKTKKGIPFVEHTEDKKDKVEAKNR